MVNFPTYYFNSYIQFVILVFLRVGTFLTYFLKYLWSLLVVMLNKDKYYVTLMYNNNTFDMKIHVKSNHKSFAIS